MVSLIDSLSIPLTPPSFVPTRTIVLVGLMGSGKTSVGWRLAQRLALPFRDADAEIERAAGLSIPEIFARYGEAHFREGERRVIARLLNEEPLHVLATGGGGFMDPRTRALIAERGISVWLRVGLDELVRRTARRKHRPLLNEGDPRQILSQLIHQRYPIYAKADIVIDGSGDDAERLADHVLKTLSVYHRSHSLNQASPSMSHPSCAAPIQLNVALGERAYPILIGSGLLERAGEWVAPLLKGRDRAIVVTDTHVGPRHLPRLTAGLAAAGIRVDAIAMPAGEATKSWTQIENLIDRLLEYRVDRGSLLLALGGGVIGDLVGFAAAITMRGLDFVQIPTSLLAQVDSSVGGKTGINTRFGKNLVGSFHQPRLVLADLDCIATLPPRELRAGYAEMVKHAVLGDLDMFSWLESGGGAALLGGDRAALAKAIQHSCATKAAIVAADEREGGRRALLNFGHTFGHALEAETGFSDRLLHGEAVAIGMVQALDLSIRLGLCSTLDKERLVAHLTACGLPVNSKACGGPFDPTRLLAHMRGDKKTKNGVLTFILATGLGSAIIREDVPASEVLPVLTETC